MRRILLSGVVGLALVAGFGCSENDDHDHDYWRERNQRIGERNTRISDRYDDGRINNSSRTYEERKASRAADQGYPGAAEREERLRRERLGY